MQFYEQFTVPPDTNVAYFAIDISSTNQPVNEIGKWDVLVLNAGFFPTPGPLIQAELDDAMKGWTTNVLGNTPVTHNLLPQRN